MSMVISIRFDSNVFEKIKDKVSLKEEIIFIMSHYFNLILKQVLNML